MKNMDNYTVTFQIDRYWHVNLDVYKPRNGISALSTELIPSVGYFLTAEGSEAGLRALAREMFDSPNKAYAEIRREIINTLRSRAEHGSKSERKYALEVLTKLSITNLEACDILMDLDDKGISILQDNT